jgi:hypothetical protein
VSQSLPPGEKERVSFAAVILLLRQMAHQLLQDGRSEEARGLIDGIDAIRVKSEGNLDGEEQKFVEEVLYELQLMAVKKPAPAAGSPGEGGDEGAAPAGGQDPSSGGEGAG